MEELKVEERQLEKEVTLLEMQGSLNLHTAPKLEKALDDLASGGQRRIGGR